MLKTAFIGNENFFDHMICEWLSEHTDLSLIVWTNKLSWAGGTGIERKKKVLKRFINRARRRGSLRTLNELLYYVIYRNFLQRKEVSQVLRAVNSTERHPQRPLAEIEQVRPSNIKSSELQHLIESLELDAIFAVCIDVYLPEKIINAPKHGAFLWHEGITPEYRGVYSPFWALAKKDYDNLGYTLLKMNSKLDAGEVFVQGKVENVDLKKDWHSYIGHKAIIDSLPQVKQFLVQLERNQHQPLSRENAIDGYYSYPTTSALLKIVVSRLFGNQISPTFNHSSEHSGQRQYPDSSTDPS
ncbi:MAG: hypothetical protein H0U18_02060 [Pyrinomonadaceae bacterium]|jgi:hypothetical protein|nr:hypothetical protein [Pyrinomonadaceae bacterium]